MSATHTAIGLTSPTSGLVSFSRPTPSSPGPQQLLVKTLAVGFTPLSLWQVDFGLLVGQEGLILGGNLVGEVVEIGQDVRGGEGIQKGDKIMSFQFASPESRAFQEFVLVEENMFTPIPSHLSIVEAATISDSFVSCYHSLVTELGVRIPLEPGSMPLSKAEASIPILVWGGSSSCGLFAIQILAAAGYTNISVTSSPGRWDLLESLGANHTFDYAKPVMTDKAFEFILDCIGDEELSIRPISKLAFKEGAKVAVLLPVRKGGYGSTSGVEMEIEVEFPKAVEVIGVRTHHYQRNEHLARSLPRDIMFDLFDRKIIKPTAFRVIEGESFLDKATKALSEVRDGKVRGEKLVIVL